MSDIRNFVAHIQKHGISRNNRFRVTIPIPPLVDQMMNPPDNIEDPVMAWIKTGIRVAKIFTGGGVEARRGLQIMCSATELPGINIDTVTVKQNGPTFKVATGVSKDDIRFDFMLSADCHEKQILDYWRRLIFDSQSQKTAYYDDYKVDVQIEMLDHRDRAIYTVLLEDAYPILFSPVQLSKRTIDELVEYRCMFTYAQLSDWKDTQGLVSGTVIGDIIEDVKNGDWQGALATTREQVLKAKEGDFSGVASSVYKMVGDVVEEATSLNLSEGNALIGSMIPGIASNGNLDSGEKDGLIGMVKDLIK